MKMERLSNAGYMWIGWHIWILIGGIVIGINVTEESFKGELSMFKPIR